MGELEKEVRKRLTILHDLAKNTKSPLGDTITKIVDLSFVPILDKLDEAKKELGNLKWLAELKEYILKHSIKLTDGTPIFSARHFAKKIDEHKEKIEKWFGDNGKAEK